MIRDERAELEVHRVPVSGSNVVLISCDHIPRKIPKEDPWPTIKEQVVRSSLVFVEYFPPELERTAYSTPILGRFARNEGDAAGINGFFGKVGQIAAENDKMIAVADIANRPSYFCYETSSMFPLPLGALLYLLSGDPLIFPILGSVGIILNLGTILLSTRRASTNFVYMDSAERFLPSIIDARRLITAEGIKQEAQRAVEGSEILYVAPHAHVNRVRHYLENPEFRTTKVKSNIYRGLPGLERDVRLYRFSQNYKSWQISSRIPV